MEGDELGANLLSGFVLLGVFSLVAIAGFSIYYRRVAEARQLHLTQLRAKEAAIEELRVELAEDKHTNRKLRYQLALVGQHDALLDSTDVDYKTLEGALDDISRLRSERDAAVGQLAERDASLRVARLAIAEIRQQIEGQQVEDGGHVSSYEGIRSAVSTAANDNLLSVGTQTEEIES